jgi:uncharacterized protein YeaO (DUF488 family)
MTTFALKRVYDDPAPSDGFRVLVDRLWPRGVSKSRAALDLWLKEIAPSPDLRIWFNHDPARFEEFSARYQAELDTNSAVGELRALAAEHPHITLLYAAHDPEINHAQVLKQYLATNT